MGVSQTRIFDCSAVAAADLKWAHDLVDSNSCWPSRIANPLPVVTDSPANEAPYR